MNRPRLTTALVFSTCAAALAVPTQAQLAPYSQDFEGLDRTDGAALANDGWRLFVGRFDAALNFLDGYTSGAGVGFPEGGAPNDIENANISVISDVPSGGFPPVGNQGLNIFSDYNNQTDQLDPNIILEANVFQERTIVAADIGKSFEFSFVAAPGDDLSATSTVAQAFFKTIDPSNNFALTNFVTADTTSLPAGNSNLSVTIDLTDPLLEGQFLQFGFLNQVNNNEASGVNYDNISFTEANSVNILGDYNDSGQVEQGDLDLVLQNWGVDTDTAGVPAGWTNDLPAGQIEQTELDGVLQNWGNTAAPDFSGSSVPEPATAAVLGGLGLIALRRRTAA